jgi:hypothetical protein
MRRLGVLVAALPDPHRGRSIGLASIRPVLREEFWMRTDPDRALLSASIAFAGAAGVGSAVAIRDQLPGQPLGITIPLSVPAGLFAGWGAGVAAPWPMPAAAVITAARAQRTGPSALAGAVCAGIGIGCILGTVVEPVTWRPRSWSPMTSAAIAVNVAASAALTIAGWRHFAAARASEPQPRT